MILYLSDFAPDTDVHARVTGALPGRTVRIYSGSAGGPTCLRPDFCLAMSAPQLLRSATADSTGAVTVSLHAPATLAVGTELVVQAVTGARGAEELSNAQPATVLAVASPPPPGGNVLVVVLDDLGVDSVSAYGTAAGAHTPTIDALAADGVRFDNAWALPLCEPSRSALMTGRYPRRTGLGSNVDPIGLNELGPEQLTLAELARLSPWFGYETAFVGKWHLSTRSSPSGLRGPQVQGFDAFVGTLGNLDRSSWSPQPAPPDAGYYHWQRVTNTGLVEETTYATTRVVDDALTVLGQLSEPWLVVVALHAPHFPWEAPPAELHTRGPLTAASPVPELQRAMTEALDTELARLLAGIAPQVRADTTVAVMGDNGTSGMAILPPFDPDRRKGTGYDGGIRVPFVVQGPGVVAGAVSTSLVSVVDLFPTVADLVGVEVARVPGPMDPASPLAIDGASLLPVLANAATPVHDVLYAEGFAPGGDGPFDSDRRAVRDGRYKLIYDVIDDREEFFEYRPGAIDEGPDLIACGTLTPRQEEARARLRARLDEWAASMPFDAAPFVDDPLGWLSGTPGYDPNCSGH